VGFGAAQRVKMLLTSISIFIKAARKYCHMRQVQIEGFRVSLNMLEMKEN